jgi:hypothetical protein
MAMAIIKAMFKVWFYYAQFSIWLKKNDVHTNYVVIKKT